MKVPSGLTIFLIFVVLMTTFSWYSYRNVEVEYRDIYYEQIFDENYEGGADPEMLEFWSVRTRILQYADMILMCVLVLSFKQDYHQHKINYNRRK